MHTPYTIETYLLLHGVSTIGAIILFLIRTEHRITKLETRLDDLKEEHDKITSLNTKHHSF